MRLPASTPAADQESRNRGRPCESRPRDIDRLVAVIRRFSEVSPSAVAALTGLVSRRVFPKDEWLLRGGDRAQLSYFITRGLVRELYIDAEGAEHTRTFLAEGSFTGSLVDLISQKPAITWIQALEHTETLAFSHSDFTKLCDEHPSLQRVARCFVESVYVRKINREYQLLALSARQRYEIWLQEGSAIDSRVRRRDLASYLGIRPEHLSRLRSNHGD
jgi:CRP-like cAMP-binding protein